MAMNKEVLIALLILGVVVWGEVQSCNSCGMECEAACGTRHFRTCCFNYLKKRSQQPSASEFHAPAMDPGLRLELWLAKSKNSFSQRFADLAPIVSTGRLQSTEQ